MGSNHLSVLVRSKDTEKKEKKQRRKPCEDETEMLPQVKEYPETPEAGRGRERFSSKEHGLADTLISDS